MPGDGRVNIQMDFVSHNYSVNDSILYGDIVLAGKGKYE